MAVTPAWTRGASSSQAAGAILMYHRITSESDVGAGLALTHFRRHLELIASQNLAVLPLAELALRTAAGTLLPRTIAVTFDDGYADHMDDIVEALQRHGATATFFVVSNALTPGFEFWWDIVDAIFARPQSLPRELRIDTGAAVRTLSAETHEQRAHAREFLRTTCHGATLEERDSILAQLQQWAGYSPSAGRPRPLSSDELRHFASMPCVEIGAHTLNHLWLPNQTPDVQWRELAGAKDELERLIGQTVTSVAYPYGAYDATTVDVARRAGFAQGVSASAGRVAPGCHPLTLPRLDAGDYDGDGFAAFLNSLS